MNGRLPPAFALLLGLAACRGGGEAHVADLLIAGGTVYDGSGDEAEVRDVAVTGRRISFVGRAAAAGVQATDTLDAAGLMVVPGFVDAHSHAPLSENYGRDGLPFLFQGITSVVIGVDGGGTDAVAETFDGYLDRGIGVNALRFVGHNAARRAAMGMDDRAPRNSEMEAMNGRADRARICSHRRCW